MLLFLSSNEMSFCMFMFTYMKNIVKMINSKLFFTMLEYIHNINTNRLK